MWAAAASVQLKLAKAQTWASAWEEGGSTMTNAGAEEGLGLGKCGEQGEEGSRTQPAEDLWLMQQGGCVKEFHVGISWAH